MRLSDKHRVLDAYNSIYTSMDMLSKGQLPESIERQIVVTPIKRALRSAYGTTNLGVALHLFHEALSCKVNEVRSWIYFHLTPSGIKERREMEREDLMDEWMT